jgi:hypothetical protein
MATKTAAKAKTSIVRNPARQLLLSAKSNGKKTTATKRKKRNPSVVTTSKVVRRKVRRNPSVNGILGLFLGGLAGGLTLGLAESGINTLAPNASASAQILIKAGGAYLINQFGGSIPVVGKYKTYVAGILAMFAGYDVWRFYVAPMLSGSGLRLPFGFSLSTEQQQPQPQTPPANAPQQRQLAPMAQPIDDSGLWAGVNANGQVQIFPV